MASKPVLEDNASAGPRDRFISSWLITTRAGGMKLWATDPFTTGRS